MNKLEGLLHRLNTLRMEPSATLAYAQGSEHHHPTVSMLGGHGGQLEIEITLLDLVIHLDTLCSNHPIVYLDSFFNINSTYLIS